MKWISVKERLPKCGKNKDGNLGWLVYKPKAVKKIVVEYTHPEWWTYDSETTQEITHWMPLPEQPK